VPLREGLFEIGDQVGDVLDANRHPDQALADADAGPLDADVGHLAGVLDQRFDAAEAFGEQEKLRAFHNLFRLLEAILHRERNHPGVPRHLSLRDLMPQVAGKTRIENLFHGGMPHQELRDCLRVLAVAIHPHGQRLQPAHGQPAIERAGHGAGRVLLILQEGPKVRIVAGDRPAHHVGMPAEVFGRAVHHQVGAERQRMLQIRGCEGVVDDEERGRALRLRNFGDGSDVRDLEVGIGGRLDPDQPRVRRDRRPRGVEVAEVDQPGGDSVALQRAGQEPVGAAVDIVRKEHFVAGLEQPANVLGGGRAAGVTKRPGCLFQRSQQVFEGSPRRIRGAAVLIALEFAQRIVPIGAGHVERNDDGAGDGIGILAASNGPGFEAPVAPVGW